jgi:hypothetical protein
MNNERFACTDQPRIHATSSGLARRIMGENGGMVGLPDEDRLAQYLISI